MAIKRDDRSIVEIVPTTQECQALLDSQSVDDRLEGVVMARDYGLAVTSLEGLLRDTSPYLVGGSKVKAIAELRFAALEALQHIYSVAGKLPDLGKVVVRLAMPVREAIQLAEAALLQLSDEERLRMLGRVAEALKERVRPRETNSSAIRAYCLLQELKLVAYEIQELDPVSLLTPLQFELAQRQTEGERPLPNLSVIGKDETVYGFVFRQNGIWVLDFAEGHEAQRALKWTRKMLTDIRRNAVPRVRRDENGVAMISDDGSFVLDGDIAHDAPDKLELLRSLMCFVGRRYFVEINENDAQTPDQS